MQNAPTRLVLVMISVAIIGFVVASPQSPPTPAAESPVPEKVSFKKDVAPILKSRCQNCHNSQRSKAGVNLEDKTKLLATKVGDDNLLVAKKPEKSALIWAVEGTHDMDPMPPRGPGLSKRDIAVLKKWITQGAKTEG